MKKETVTEYLLRRLDASSGMHSKIAKECGIAQATISRIYLRKCSPRLDFVERLLEWFDQHDGKKTSASCLPHARRRVKAGSADTAPALSQ